jgi:large subunit ribosomal protein L15
MQIHELKRKTENKKSAQVGRGGKRGKTSGRGTKGQKARSGRKIRPEYRDVIKKIPKLRGYAFNSIKNKPIVVNVGDLGTNFKNGDTVNPEAIFAKEIVSFKKGMKVKILGGGEISVKINVEKCLVSAEAKAKIEKAGGSIK